MMQRKYYFSNEQTQKIQDSKIQKLICYMHSYTHTTCSEPWNIPETVQ